VTKVVRFFSGEVQGCPEVRAIEYSPEPIALLGRLEERVIAEDFGMLPLNCVFDLADSLGHDIPDSLDMLWYEQEVPGIDVSGFDEASGLLGTAAGVALIYQSTLVIHEVVKIAAGTGETLAEVIGGYLQNLGADRVADTEDRTECEDQPLLAVQAKQHACSATILCLFQQQRHFNRDAVRIGQFKIGRTGDGGPVVGECRRLCFRPSVLHVEDVIGGDAVEPSAKRALALEGTEFSDDFDQHLLSNFLRVLRPEDHANCDVVNPSLVPENEILQRGSITILGFFNKNFIQRFRAVDFRERVEHGWLLNIAEVSLDTLDRR
jgi:hypothetical protein